MHDMVRSFAGAHMPHDWSETDLGIFHDFHQAWTVELCHALNAGALPRDFYSLITGNLEHDSAVAAPAPELVYAHKANRIAIRHKLGKVVAVIEIVSPGNKGSRAGIRSFVEKMGELLREEINLLVVDLFPPFVARSSGDSQGDLGRG